jgi:hypothetical protein
VTITRLDAVLVWNGLIAKPSPVPVTANEADPDADDPRSPASVNARSDPVQPQGTRIA